MRGYGKPVSPGARRRGRRASRAATAIALFLVLLGAGCTGSSGRKPNIILISVDTLRPDHLGCYGYDRPTSPAIDALASRGVRFENVFSPASWTIPAHMSIMTSEYPHVHGVDAPDRKLDPQAATLAGALSKEGYRTAAFITWFYLSWRLGFDIGFDEYNEYLPKKRDTSLNVRADVPVDRAVEWIDRNGDDAPFFLFLHLFDPHVDYDPPSPYDTLFGASYDGDFDGSYESIRPYIKGLRDTTATIAPADRRRAIDLYDGEIRYVDDQVGRLVDALAKRRLDEKTILVFTADHGEEFAEHGSMEGHGWTLYDEVIRVPLIIARPGADPAVVSHVASLVDVAPTILDLAGVPLPETFEGRALFETEEGGGGDTVVFGEIRRFNFRWYARSATWKLILTSGPEKNVKGVPVKRGVELYDVASNPGETVNLFSPESPAGEDLLMKLYDFARRGNWAGAPVGGNATFSEEEKEKLRAAGYVD